MPRLPKDLSQNAITPPESGTSAISQSVAFDAAAAALAGIEAPGSARSRGAVDAALIAACEQFMLAETQERHLFELADIANEAEPGSGAAKIAELAHEHFTDGGYFDAVLNLMALLPPRTMPGLRAAARAVHAYYEPDPPHDGSDMAEVMWSIVCVLAGKAHTPTIPNPGAREAAAERMQALVAEMSAAPAARRA